MNDPVIDISQSLQKIEVAAGPVVIDPALNSLPSTGYRISDRLFVGPSGSTNSVHICITNDDFPWGNWWMPVQDQNSPWRALTAQMLTGGFTQNASFQARATVNNRSQMLFNGALTPPAGFANDTDLPVFQPLPDGMRPPTDMSFICSINPTVFDAGTTYEKVRYARLNLNANGTSSMRIHGGTPGTTTEIWLNQVKFFIGRNDYDSP